MTDIALAVVEHLNASVGGILTAYHTAPAQTPDEFATVRLAGGSRDIFRSRPTVIVKCWARSRKAADALARAVCGAMLSAPDDMEDVFSCSVLGDYREPQPPKGYEQRVITLVLDICD